VPRRGDDQEDQRGGDEVELGEPFDLAGEREVEHHEGQREDDADQAFGEEAERQDGGEAEHGEKC